MMRLWFLSYVRRSSTLPEAILSSVAHVVLIVLWVFATLPPAQVAEDSISNRIYYIPPPDKLPGRATAVHEVVHFVSLEGKGLGEDAGQGPRTQGSAPPTLGDGKVAGWSATRCSTRPRSLRRRRRRRV